MGKYFVIRSNGEAEVHRYYTTFDNWTGFVTHWMPILPIPPIPDEPVE
jgi:hypothetical protein